MDFQILLGEIVGAPEGYPHLSPNHGDLAGLRPSLARIHRIGALQALARDPIPPPGAVFPPTTV